VAVADLPPPAPVALAPLAAAGCALAVVYAYALLSRPHPRAAEALLPGGRGAAAAARAPGPRPSRPLRLLDALGRLTGPALASLLGPDRTEAVRYRLLAAGSPAGMGTGLYLARVSATGVVGTVLSGVLLVQGSPVRALVALLAGWTLVEVWLRAAVERRQRRLELELPDFLDVLGVVVAAGLGFRTAMVRAGEQLGGVVGEEVRVTASAWELGLSRRDGLEGLRRRNPAPTLGAFVSTVLQSEELGSPLAGAVLAQAEQLRADRLRAARKRAARAESRVLGISAVFFLPAMLLLLVSSLVVSFADEFAGIFSL